MNKTEAQALAKDLEEAVGAVLKKHGIDSKKKSGFTYTPDGSISYSVKASTVEATGHNVGLALRLNGVSEEQANKVFETQGKKFRLVDYNSRSYKMPWVCEEVSSGKQFKFSTDAIKLLLA